LTRTAYWWWKALAEGDVMDRLVERPLTETEMAHIEHVIADADDNVEIVLGAIISTFEVLMTPEGWAAAEEVDPTQYAIPREQSATICGWMLDRSEKVQGGLPIDSVNVALDWMNKGPSFYDPPQCEICGRADDLHDDELCFK
jgi:hypothetical protein